MRDSKVVRLDTNIHSLSGSMSGGWGGGTWWYWLLVCVCVLCSGVSTNTQRGVKGALSLKIKTWPKGLGLARRHRFEAQTRVDVSPPDPFDTPGDVRVDQWRRGFRGKETEVRRVRVSIVPTSPPAARRSPDLPRRSVWIRMCLEC